MLLLCGAALAVATSLFYCFFTQQVWEDYFITFKFSQNLCDGKGLVYYEGERVHGFTSPLGVLLPAFCQWVTGGKTYEPALWLFRLLICVPAFALGGVLLMRTMLASGRRSLWPAALLGILYAFESKSVAYSVNGMETALMLLFLAWTLLLLSGQGIRRRWLWLGLAWAGLMWTRPDSCVYIAASAVVALVFASDRRAVLLCLVKAGLVTTVIYLPWFVWAWAYYGTPVPHTITAKGAGLVGGGLVRHFLGALWGAKDAAALSYAPPYAPLGNCSPMLGTLCVVCGGFGAFYWLFPSRDRLGRMASLLFLLLCVYFAFMPRTFPWYYPPAAAMGLVAVARGVFVIFGHFCPTRYSRRRGPICALALLCALFVCSFAMFRLSTAGVAAGG